MKTTKIHLHLSREQVKPLALDEYKDVTHEDLAKLGVTADFNHAGVKMAMDAAPDLVMGSANIGNLVQFFQYWFPTAIKVITAKRNADSVFGRDIVGSWELDEVVQKYLEATGQVSLYGDYTDVPLVSYNPTFEKRQNVRFELGMQSGLLQDAKAARMQISPDEEKRTAIATAFAVNQNEVAFLGYNTTDIPCYGGLNDPNLCGFNASTGVTTPNAYDITEDSTFSNASRTFLTIVASINTWMTTLQAKSGYNFDPYNDKLQLSIAPTAYNAMVTTMNQLGTKSVMSWFMETYKGATVKPINEFKAANGAADVAYIIADTLGGQPVVRQLVTAEMRLIGVEPKLKGTLEGYTSSTAGTMFVQPLGCLRVTGV